MVVERNRSIDAIKGILIFLVVVGHILLGTLDENIFRYVIYFFHMPAFFFVSGYLLNMERLAKIKYKDVFFKYWKRMLMEYSIAWLIYTIYALHDGFNIMDVIHYIYRPFYHLWFIPALFVMTSALWVTYRIVKDEKVRYILLFSLAFLFYNISNTEFAASPAFSCYLMLFLLIGIFCRIHLAKINISGGVIIIVCISTIVCIYTFINSSMLFARTYLEIPICLVLCLLGILPIMQRGMFHGKILEFWGRNSLRIYLWHVIPIIILKKLFTNNELLYYAVSAIAILMSIIFTQIATKRLTVKI